MGLDFCVGCEVFLRVVFWAVKAGTAIKMMTGNRVYLGEARAALF